MSNSSQQGGALPGRSLVESERTYDMSPVDHISKATHDVLLDDEWEWKLIRP